MNARGTEQTTRTRPARIWPPPWWTVASLLVLIGLVTALAWVGVTLATPLALPTQLPALVLITVTPAQAQPTPQAVTPVASGQFAPGDAVQVANTNGFDLRLRSGPGILYETVKMVPEGTSLEITGEPRQADNHLWWPVRDPADSSQGWVVSDYIQRSAP
jgi:hypothetical protein